MKKSVKKYQPGGLVDSDGNPVRDGSGNPIMTGSFPDEDEITARGRAQNAEMLKSFFNRATGRGKETPAPAEPVATPMASKAPAASDGDVDERDRRMEAAASAPSRMPTRPGQSSSGSKPSAVPKVTQSPKAKDTSMDSAIMAGEARKRKSVQEASARDAAVMSDEARKRKTKNLSSASSSNDGTGVSAAQKYRDENQKGVSPILTGLLGFGAGFAGKKLVQAGARKLASNQAKKEAAKTTSTATKSPLRQKTEQLIREDKNPGRSVRPAPATPKVSLKEKTKELIQSDRTAKSKEMSRQMAEKQTPTKFTSKKSTSTPKKLVSSKRAKKFNDDESKVEFKRGGRIQASSASKRADGIAQRGKTRGKVY